MCISVIYGLIPEEQTQSVLNSLKERDELLNDSGKNDTYTKFCMLGALYEDINIGAAENLIKSFWGSKIKSNLVDPNDKSYEIPAYYMTTRILGVNLGYPVFSNPREVIISPEAENIEWAKGKVPNPWGDLYVEWHIKDKKLFVNCQVPRHVNLTVKPRGKLAEKQLWVNGKRIEK